MSLPKRSSTGGHVLLPASNSRGDNVFIPLVPTHNVVSWTFGRGTVIWTIWPAVLLHTAFAALVTSFSLTTRFYLGVPPVLITVLGVVIGFVIAYRASSGYDRYWMGRCCWSDLVKSARTMGRLIWFHVPLKMHESETSSTHEDILHIMREKRLALELVEGFIVALKHHLRGEMGIYYEDLYHLVKPLHDHPHQQPQSRGSSRAKPDPLQTTTIPPTPPAANVRFSDEEVPSIAQVVAGGDPVIPAITDYGTFKPVSSSTNGELEVPRSAMRQRGRVERRGSTSGSSSCSERSASQGHTGLHERPFLLPSTHQSSSASISADLIPFSSFVSSFLRLFRRKGRYVLIGEESGEGNGVITFSERNKNSGRKSRPKIAGGGENLPLEILRCLSEWICVLDERGVAPGNPLSGMYGCLAAFEDSLSALERILTTPLPFVYSAHIRQCVWLYLFLLPFQLVDQFGWFTIPGVGVAAFFYIGFLAAGEEIEQPFGYDENDLDLDLFCRDIVHADMEALLRTPCPNVYLPSKVHGSHAQRRDSGITRAAARNDESHSTSGKVKLQDVFGNIP